MQEAIERHLGRTRPISEPQEWFVEPLRKTFQHLVNRVDVGRDRTRSAHLNEDNVYNVLITTCDFAARFDPIRGDINVHFTKGSNTAYWGPFVSGVFLGEPESAFRGFDALSSGSSAMLVGGYPTAELEDFYALADQPNIIAFLSKHEYLLDLLFEIPEIVRQHFGSDVRLSLKLSKEPDAVNDQRLFVLIHAVQPLAKAMDLLDNLDDAWWLDRMFDAKGKMSLDIAAL